MSYNALPSGYQWLEYISSTGTQYINTGVYRTTNTRILLEFEYTAAPSNDQASIGMMNVSGDNDGGFAIFIGSNGSFSQCIKRSSYSAPYPLTLNQKYKVDFNNDDKVYVNDTLVATFNNNPITTVTKGFPIFASMWDNYDLILYVSAKLYSYKMYESETLIRDFIPCKNSSNEIGLYDTVSNAFYANSGTGMFVAGPAATRTITYNMMGHGTQISPQTVAFGQAGTAPTSPIVEGYAFGGWYNESTCTTLYDWTSIVTEDKTLYAKWTAVVIVSAPVITSIDWTKSMQ